MSKVVPSAWAVTQSVPSTVGWLLATLVGTGGRATGDLFITSVCIRNLLNLLIVSARRNYSNCFFDLCRSIKLRNPWGTTKASSAGGQDMNFLSGMPMSESRLLVGAECFIGPSFVKIELPSLSRSSSRHNRRSACYYLENSIEVVIYMFTRVNYSGTLCS
jgi:hypothetical protein